MNSIAKTSPTNNKNVKIHTNSSPNLSKKKWRHSSFSSNSSSSSSFTSSSPEEEFSLPNTPSSSSSSSSSLSRIPFSWETIPGIPKTQVLKKIDSCRNSKLTILPLPPPASNNAKKGHNVTSSDPFYAALIECSKRSDVDNQEVFSSGSIAKSISTRFGQVNMSCKNYTKVANSVIFMPRGGQKRISNEVLKKHFG